MALCTNCCKILYRPHLGIPCGCLRCFQCRVCVHGPSTTNWIEAPQVAVLVKSQCPDAYEDAVLEHSHGIECKQVECVDQQTLREVKRRLVGDRVNPQVLWDRLQEILPDRQVVLVVNGGPDTTVLTSYDMAQLWCKPSASPAIGVAFSALPSLPSSLASPLPPIPTLMLPNDGNELVEVEEDKDENVSNYSDELRNGVAPMVPLDDAQAISQYVHTHPPTKISRPYFQSVVHPDVQRWLQLPYRRARRDRADPGVRKWQKITVLMRRWGRKKHSTPFNLDQCTEAYNLIMNTIRDPFTENTFWMLLPHLNTLRIQCAEYHIPELVDWYQPRQ